MRALLLAAGLGTRLRPLTESVPKCLVPVAGRPPLLRNIDWLRDSGVDHVAINLHHLPEAVRGAVGDGSELGVDVFYSYEPALLGTSGAVWACRDWLAGDAFLVVYADNVVECDLERLVALHRQTAATLTMALHFRDDVGGSGLAELDSGFRIRAFVEKPGTSAPPGGWVNAGVLVCEPRVLEQIPPARSSDFGRDVVPALLAAGELLSGYRMGAGERVVWIDTPSDLARAEEQLRGQAVPR